jgi:hypothetical protein
MTNLNLASAKEIKALVEAGAVAHVDAIARVDALLARKTLADGKKARWLRLREWLMKAQEAV